MNEQNFTNRLEASLKRGMESVPLLALEPARARYRIAPAKLGRRLSTPLTVAIAAIGLTLFAGIMGAAASGTSPATVVSNAIHQVVVLVQQISVPPDSVRATPSPDPGSGPAGGSQPPAMQQGPGGVPPTEPSESPTPAPTAEPTPAPTEEPTAPPAAEPLAIPPEDTSPSLSPDPLESPATTP
jgi:hypothetical protein